MMKLILNILFSSLLLTPIFNLSFAQEAPSSKELDHAIRTVEQDTGGQVLSAETRRRNGEVRHRIKIITPAGRVRIIYIDAR